MHPDVHREVQSIDGQAPPRPDAKAVRLDSPGVGRRRGLRGTHRANHVSLLNPVYESRRRTNATAITAISPAQYGRLPASNTAGLRAVSTLGAITPAVHARASVPDAQRSPMSSPNASAPAVNARHGNNQRAGDAPATQPATVS